MLILLTIIAHSAVCSATVPQDNPFATRYPSGVIPNRASINGFNAESFPWTNVVSVTDIDGNLQNDPAELFKTAAEKVLKANPEGGVVFFPSGTYIFSTSLELVDGVVLRGAPDVGDAVTNVHEGSASPGSLAPKTKFQFPDRSYSLMTCANCSVSGVVNIFSDGGAVSLTRPPSEHESTFNPDKNMFLVLSNKFVNVVYKYPVAPPGTSGNEWPYRFSTVISVTGGSNVLIANNLIAKATASATTKVTFTGPRTELVEKTNAPRTFHFDKLASCSGKVVRNVSKAECAPGAKPLHEYHHADPDGSECCGHCRDDTNCTFWLLSNDGKKCHTYAASAECKPGGSGKDIFGTWSGPHPKPPAPHPSPSPPHPPPSPPGPSPEPTDFAIALGSFLGDSARHLVPVAVHAAQVSATETAFVVVGNGDFDFGLVPVVPIGSAGNATMVLIDADGAPKAVYRFPGAFGHAASAPSGTRITVVGTALVLAVDITSTSTLTVAWHRTDLEHTLGFPLCASTRAHSSNANLDNCRVSVGEDGTAAVFTGGKGSWNWLSLVLAGEDGSVVGNHTYGKTHYNAIAIDTSRGNLWDAGFQDDKLPGGLPVQVCSVFCHAYRQNSSCPPAPLYDYAGKELATNQADTRVSFVGFFNDTLYFAGRAAGGNSVFRYQPHDLNTQAPNVATDKYNEPYNLGGPLISYIALVDPTTARVSAGTFLLTRSTSGKGNQLQTASLSVDARGNVVAAVNAGFTIDRDNSTTVSGQRMGTEGMGVVILSHDLRLRRAWVLFSAGGGTSQSEAVDVSCSRSGWCAVVGIASGDMITKNEIEGSTAPSKGLSSGFLVLFKTTAIA